MSWAEIVHQLESSGPLEGIAMTKIDAGHQMVSLENTHDLSTGATIQDTLTKLSLSHPPGMRLGDRELTA